MNTWLVALVSVCYAGTGVDFFLRGQPAWGVFWTAYAVANVAFIIAMR